MRAMVQRGLAAFSVTVAMNGMAHAAPASEARSITVPVSANDMATESAQERLIARLRFAASKVCGEEYRDNYLVSHACYVGTLEDALAQLHGLRAKQVASAASIVMAAR